MSRTHRSLLRHISATVPVEHRLGICRDALPEGKAVLGEITDCISKLAALERLEGCSLQLMMFSLVFMIPGCYLAKVYRVFMCYGGC